MEVLAPADLCLGLVVVYLLMSTLSDSLSANKLWKQTKQATTTDSMANETYADMLTCVMCMFGS